jgi:hypothetical protein
MSSPKAPQSKSGREKSEFEHVSQLADFRLAKFHELSSEQESENAAEIMNEPLQSSYRESPN